MATMLDIDDAWGQFCDGDYTSKTARTCVIPAKDNSASAPKCSDIYISTKTKISYLDSEVDLAPTFWSIPVVPYHIPRCGVIKKQMKFNSSSVEQLNAVQSMITPDIHTEQHIISRIVNPEGRIKFKDTRKISVGLCKKDITSYKCKKKGAFYNCFALILRIDYEGSFKEIHVKVFNTGKLEIPGIQDDRVLVSTLDLLTKTLNQLPNAKPVQWLTGKSETVLINSNFSCGYYVDRDKLCERLKYHYRINSAYDPCSYPGIQCEFYYDTRGGVQSGRQPSKDEAEHFMKVSFMVFRTGSVLIVGKCTERMLEEIYMFLKAMLENEYHIVGGKLLEEVNDADSIDKKKKVRKKTIIIS
jgi:hypothetical protein